MRILKHLSRQQKQATSVVIGALRIKTYTPESGFKLFETLIVFVKDFFFKKNNKTADNKNHEKYPACKELMT